MSQAEAVATAEPLVARWLTPLELTVLGAIWGASFLFMRVSAREFGALPLVEMRLDPGSADSLAAPLARPHAVQARTRSAAHRDLRDQLGDSVLAVRVGSPAGAGRHRCDHERDGSHVHRTRGIRGLWRTHQQAARDRSVRGIRRRRGARERQDGRRQRLERGARRNVRRIPLRHRRQHDPSAAGWHSVGRSRGWNARVCLGVARAVRDSLLAAHADSRALVGKRGAARRALHWHRLSHLLPADLPRRRIARRHSDVSRAAIRRRVGLDRARRAAHAHHGDRRRADSRRRRARASSASSADNQRGTGLSAVAFCQGRTPRRTSSRRTS